MQMSIILRNAYVCQAVNIQAVAWSLHAHTLHGMVQKSYAGLGIRSSVLRANRSFFVSERKRANRSHRDPILNGRSFVKSDSLLGIKRGKTVKNCQKHMKNANCSLLRFCLERLEREQKITCFL